MTDRIPHYVRSMTCSKVTTGAVTYHLMPIGDRVLGEWAIATVNDATGELAIQSDWGNWSFRWNTDHIGCASLTEFIADRNACHYLADKLTSREQREHFDAHSTVEHMQREIVQNRLSWGRNYLSYYDHEDCDVMDPDPPDAIGELRSEDNVDRFCEAFFKIEGHDIVSSEPWDGDIKYAPSVGYMQLLHGILPALVQACFERLYPGRHRCEKTMRREDGAGHWRDFHRGHGCHLDDMPVAPPAAVHP